MSTTLEKIRKWLTEGWRQEAKYLIVVCDTYDHSDFPVYATDDADVLKKHAENDNEDAMLRVMEVYDLSVDVGPQLREHRAMHLPTQGGGS